MEMNEKKNAISAMMEASMGKILSLIHISEPTRP